MYNEKGGGLDMSKTYMTHGQLHVAQEASPRYEFSFDQDSGDWTMFEYINREWLEFVRYVDRVNNNDPFKK